MLLFLSLPLRSMPNSCVIAGCTIRANAESGISFSSFPKDPERRRLWIVAVNRKDWAPKVDSRVCGRHFLLGSPYPFNSGHPDDAPCIELTSSTVVNERHLEDAQRRLERYRRTQERRRKLLVSMVLPVDHAAYSRPLSEQPARKQPRSQFVDYPPVCGGKL